MTYNEYVDCVLFVELASCFLFCSLRLLDLIFSGVYGAIVVHQFICLFVQGVVAVVTVLIGRSGMSSPVNKTVKNVSFMAVMAIHVPCVIIILIFCFSLGINFGPRPEISLFSCCAIGITCGVLSGANVLRAA